MKARSRQHEQGSAVLVVLALLAVMCLLLASNTVTLNSLKRELRLIEEKQVQRCTNSPVVLHD